MFCGFNFCTNNGTNVAEKEGAHSFLHEFSYSEDTEYLLCGGIVFGGGHEVIRTAVPALGKLTDSKRR